MSTHPTDSVHIALDDRGLAYVRGTGVRVRRLGLEQAQSCLSPLQLRWRYPDLTLSQIQAALDFYRDHRARMDYEALLDH